jgi:hypothetical protein
LGTEATFAELATPILRAFGYEPERKHPRSAKDWMHWHRDESNIVRAYALRDGDHSGVSIIGEGEIPTGLREALIERVTEATNWRIAHSPSP